MFRRLFSWIQKYERPLSAIAMVAGFVSDNLLFGRIDIPRTEIVFEVYAVACFISIPLYHFIQSRSEKRKKASGKFWSILPLVTQFALGGFWSGFLIFYTRASSISASWPFLLLLVLILIGNEYFKQYHARLVFTSVLFFFALYSYAIFAVPITTKTMNTTMFLISGAVAVALFIVFLIILRLSGRTRYLREAPLIRLGAVVILIIINVFYFTNILPPLPLSAKALSVYDVVWKTGSTYMAETQSEPWQVRYLGARPVFQVPLGGTLSTYSSVFAPTALKVSIKHVWQWFNPATKKWETEATIQYPIIGGNDGGYRGYSTAGIYEVGKWRVSIETNDAKIIDRKSFYVKESTTTPALLVLTLK